MTRQELEKSYQIDSDFVVDTAFTTNPAAWLAGQATAKDLTWLLAHADDGAIWGKVENGSLRLSGDIFDKISPPLRSTTLQQLWLFGLEAELYLWQIEPGRFSARLLTEIDSVTPDCLEEEYLLWGTSSEQSKEGFTVLVDGKQGLNHAVPLSSVQIDEQHRLSLTIRHYLAYDEDGQAYIKVSRLVRLNNGGDHA